MSKPKAYFAHELASGCLVYRALDIEEMLQASPSSPTSEGREEFKLGQAFVSRVTSEGGSVDSPAVIGRVERDDELLKFALGLAIAALDEEGCICQPDEDVCALCACREASAHLKESATLRASLTEAQAEIERLKAWRSDVTVALLRPGGAHYEDVAKHVKEMRSTLSELHEMVCGECPSLLNEDSGGDATLALRIERILGRSDGAQ